MKIINCKNKSDIDVEFQDDYRHLVEHTLYVNFKKGQIKNPYDRNVYGVGYIGVGKHHTGSPENHTLSYVTWFGMIRRCYSEKKKEKFPAYYGICTICDAWCNYQNFAEWFDENYYNVDERLHIDKDILFANNKEYAPDKCLLVPQRINMLFMNKPNKRGLPNGIHMSPSGKYRANYNHKNLGTYDCLSDAYGMYAKEKELSIMNIAEEYKNLIPERLYYALLNYKVEITNDRNYIA